MNKTIRHFNYLSAKELHEILRVRAEVFVLGQKIAYVDPDEYDFQSYHLYFSDDGKIIAYLRIIDIKDDRNFVKIGRVLSLLNGKGLGSQLMRDGINFAKKITGAEGIYIEAQSYVSYWYKKLGFVCESEEFLIDGIPHIRMTLKF